MTLERNNLPAWAERDRWTDLAWIWDNLATFHFAAGESFYKAGRGAIVVDTTTVAAGDNHPCAYFTAEAIRRYEDEDINRLVDQYIPHDELVVVLLKAADRTSAYRIRSRPLEEDPGISTY